MKKIIMFLMFALFTISNINANEVKIINASYKQTQVLNTIFPELVNYRSEWIKQDSVQVEFDFYGNKKIVINDLNIKNEYRIIKIDTIHYDNSNYYKIKSVDSNNIKYDIEVLYFNDEKVFLSIFNEYSVVRYKFIN